jgi:hypothetical protein
MPDALKPKEELDLYENGKGRRYSLLFAVNGGAFAIARLIGEGRDTGALSVGALAIGMIIFTMVMTLDIFAFGFWCKNRFAESVFGRIGQIVLGLTGTLISAGWLLVAFRDSKDPYGNSAVTLVAVLLAGAALISFINEYVSRQFKDEPAAEEPAAPTPGGEQST